MKGKKIGYIRVSTPNQNPSRQLVGIEIDKVFLEKVSGKTMHRPELESMIEYCREDDVIFVHSMDRLARNLIDLRKIIDKFLEKNVSITFIKENLTFTGNESPMATFLLNVMGAFGEFERQIIRERQLEGIAIAKQKGKYMGRKRALNSEQIEEIKKMLEIGHYKVDIAKRFNITKQTLFNYLHREGITVKKQRINI